MAEIGRSDLLIVPKFESKLSDTINKELGVASKSASNTGHVIGSQTAQGFSGGFAQAGIVAGAVSSIVNRAMTSIQEHVGAAVSRFDTLTLYPRTMQSVGFTAKEATASINYMSDRLQSLPTQLDTMVQTVKGLAVITDDLDRATKVGLGLNDMLIASGANQQLAASAMEQFRQILSKGKPDMQDWKSLMQAMPGQLTQLAHALLGPTYNARDLYAALGGGKQKDGGDVWGTVSIDQLIDAIIRLDLEGGAGITSFKEQAQTAAGGIETQMANMNNAITRGLAGTLEAIGSVNIASFFGDVRGSILAGFKTFNGFIKDAVPTVKTAIPVFQALAPAVIGGVAAFSLFGKVEPIIKATSTFNMLAKAASQFAYGGVFGVIKSGFTSLISSINPVTAGIVAIGAVVGIAASQFMKMKEHSDGVANGLKSINEVAKQSHGLSTYSSMIDKIADTAGGAAMSVDALMKSISDSNSKIANTLSEATTNVGTLERARTIISNYAGATDLSTQAQGQLSWALSTLNEQLGLNISSTDVMNNSYTDANGNVQKLTDSINELVSAKEKEIKTAALTETLTEQYKQRAAAAQTLVDAENKLNEKYTPEYHDEYISNATKDGTSVENAEKAYQAGMNLSDEGKAVRDARKAYEELDAAVRQTEGDLEVNSKAVDANSDAYNGLVSRLSDLAQAYIKQHGSLVDFSSDLQTLGADTTQLGDLTDEQWRRIAQAYDGTAASLVQPLRELGVTLNETSVFASEAAKQINDALNSFGANDAIESVGINVNDLSAAMANAGITAQDLQAIGSENFKALAINSNGNIQSIVAAVQSLNAQGVNDKSFTITAHDNASSVLRSVKAELNSLHDKNLFVNLIKQNAAGGIRANAAGGLRMHADGAIVNRATPLDIVGEDGAEAIIPLTNKRYVKPFADAVAEGILGQSTNDALIRWLAQNLGAIIAASAPVVTVSEREQRRQIREMMA